MSVMTTISGIDAAPSDVTITGAMPVTRMTPARPTTNAPHQFVSLREPAALVLEDVGMGVGAVGLVHASPLPAVRRLQPSGCNVRYLRRRVTRTDAPLRVPRQCGERSGAESRACATRSERVAGVRVDEEDLLALELAIKLVRLDDARRRAGA